ncbi:hypothetical protein McanCB49686_004476 [Microsporum canis]
MTLLLGLFSGRGEPRSPFSALLMLASVLSLLLGLVHARDTAPAGNQTVIFDLNLYNRVDGPAPQVTLRACGVPSSPPALKRRQLFLFSPNSSTKTTGVQLLWRTGEAADDASSALGAAAVALADRIRAHPSNGATILFAKKGQTILGVYAGPQLEKKSVSDVVQLFSNKARGKKEVKQVAVQACNEDSLRYSASSRTRQTISRRCRMRCDAGTTLNVSTAPHGTRRDAAEQHIEQADTCSYTQAVAGDGCYALASWCKVTQEKLVEYNGNPKLCETLVVAKPGSNGCISSCGIATVNNHDKPANFMRVGYFEAWNKDRPCLHMLPRQIDSSHYTHIRFAFGDVTKEFKVDISKLQDMFDEFKKMKSAKRILSFGGCSSSTKALTVSILTKGGKDDDDDKDQTIWLTSSVTFPPVTLTQTSTSGITRPLITWTYSPGPYPSPAVRAPDNPNIPKDPKDPDPTPTPTPTPPPPHGFPPNVRVTSGTPKPTCRPGQMCGQKCQINCNPPDSGCLGLYRAILPRREKLCRAWVLCCYQRRRGRGRGSYELPNEGKECSRTITGCDATGSTTTSTTTVTCPSPAAAPHWNPNDQIPILGDGGFGGDVITTGDFPKVPRPTTTKDTTTTEKPPTTTTDKPDPPPFPSLPLPTYPSDPEFYCFRKHNDDKRYKVFPYHDSLNVIHTLCSFMKTLPKESKHRFSARGDNDLRAYVAWAEDQSGCNPQTAVPLDDFCVQNLSHILVACDDQTVEDRYGGAFILNGHEGCVTWWVGADSTLPKARQQIGNPNGPSQSEQKVLHDKIAALEPELPRVKMEATQSSTAHGAIMPN